LIIYISHLVMASVFTFDPDPPRVSSPWSTPGSSTPQSAATGAKHGSIEEKDLVESKVLRETAPNDTGAIRKLDAEPQEGATEYKLHLLLRPRRSFSFTSTNQFVSGSSHSKARLSSSGSQQVQDVIENSQRLPQAPSNQTRQHRLQQLTTQLLWRLQQSSPYHSSSTADLVLPVLPESNTQLDVPESPARLLAGLEESQGALYEIGVSDDGTFVGLAPDEMDESLTNLRAMAASLGCKVEILRKVAVGTCEWVEGQGFSEASTRPTLHSETLWVTEALVKPDLTLSGQKTPGAGDESTRNGHSRSLTSRAVTGELLSYTEQIRISVIGATTSGKSSLIGTLSTSTLDNGRGKSRLSLLKHRHEIATGVTTSVAQELVGYNTLTLTRNMSANVINYASGNVSSWNDIHAGSEGQRLAFISDSAGHPRYAKTILRSLMSWNPHWTLLCIAADDPEDNNTGNAGATASRQDALAPTAAGSELSLAHMSLCIALQLPLVVVITKLDLTSKTGLRQTLAKVLSALKAAGRKPLMLSSSTDGGDHGLDLQHVSEADDEEVARAIYALDKDNFHIVPIVFTSSVTGSGIGRVHALLKSLPMPSVTRLELPSAPSTLGDVPTTLFQIDEVYQISPSKIYTPDSDPSGRKGSNTGFILSGYLRYGCISIGEELTVGPLTVDSSLEVQQSDPIHRSSSFPNRDQSLKPFFKADSSHRHRHHSGELRTSTPFLETDKARQDSRSRPETSWPHVRVVSLRNLRLPVRKLLEGQAGTIGIELFPQFAFSTPSHPSSTAHRIRKGHVLAEFDDVCPAAYSGFVASFPLSFSSTLVLTVGTSVLTYIANIRAAARVTRVSRRPPPSHVSANNSAVPLSSDLDLFSFDDSDCDPSEVEDGANEPSSDMNCGDLPVAETRIHFSFVTSIEWFELGTKVLVMLASGPSSSVSGSSSSGLECFVGSVVEGLR
jgi:GTPase